MTIPMAKLAATKNDQRSAPTEAQVVLDRNVLRIMYCERHSQYQQKKNQQEIEELFH